MNLDSARQSTIEACGPNDEAIVKTMAEKEDRLGKAAASPNSQNLTERGIEGPPPGLRTLRECPVDICEEKQVSKANRAGTLKGRFYAAKNFAIIS